MMELNQETAARFLASMVGYNDTWDNWRRWKRRVYEIFGPDVHLVRYAQVGTNVTPALMQNGRFFVGPVSLVMTP